LSGIKNTDFVNSVWGNSFHDSKKRAMVTCVFKFGGVDFQRTINVNGKNVKNQHVGSASFLFEITIIMKGGENGLIALNKDDI
jgi:hypothetical protein